MAFKINILSAMRCKKITKQTNQKKNNSLLGRNIPFIWTSQNDFFLFISCEGDKALLLLLSLWMRTTALWCPDWRDRLISSACRPDVSSDVRSWARRFAQPNSASFINIADWLDGDNVCCWERSMRAACRESVEETERSSERNRPGNPGAEAQGVCAGKNDCMVTAAELKLIPPSNITLNVWKSMVATSSCLSCLRICCRSSNLYTSDLQGNSLSPCSCLMQGRDLKIHVFVFSTTKPATHLLCVMSRSGSWANSVATWSSWPYSQTKKTKTTCKKSLNSWLDILGIMWPYVDIHWHRL